MANAPRSRGIDDVNPGTAAFGSDPPENKELASYLASSRSLPLIFNLLTYAHGVRDADAVWDAAAVLEFLLLGLGLATPAGSMALASVSLAGSTELVLASD
jgi:hypothetical protein